MEDVSHLNEGVLYASDVCTGAVTVHSNILLLDQLLCFQMTYYMLHYFIVYSIFIITVLYIK